MSAHHKSQDQGFALWQPDLGWWTSSSTRLQDSFVALSNEWQAFVASRVKEDLHLWQELAGARTPDAIWSSYTGFWQKAVEDYQKECAKLAQLSGSFAAGVTDAQQPTEVARPKAA